MNGQLQPGIVADRNGEHYWFSGLAMVPKRYDKFPIWGSGFTHDSQLFRDAAPFRQVAVLTDTPDSHGRSRQPIMHSPVKKTTRSSPASKTKHDNNKNAKAKFWAIAIAFSVVATIAVNTIISGVSELL